MPPVYRLFCLKPYGLSFALQVVMNCPICNIQLKMAERQGVEINYCPDCRGVWVDRGGLDKIIDRSGAQIPAPRAREEDRHHHKDDSYRESHGHRRKSFFSELFD
jgi:uncharacterized protein